MRRRGRDQRGQATVEWIGLLCLVSLAGLALAAAGVRLPGVTLASELVEQLVCAAGLELDGCLRAEPDLVAAYGPELASRVVEHAPKIEYEEGMRALPVDFRRCRRDACSVGAGSGAVSRSTSGEPVTLFTRVVDCRPGSRTRRSECSGERRGRVYIQYWAYYPGSQTARTLLGEQGFHPDDWESYQLRLNGPRGEARASSHHGYNHAAGPENWLSDLGLTERAAWGREAGSYYVSGGSHAGHVWEPRDGATPLPRRWTPARRIRLLPLERLAAEARHRWRFAVSPPWRKRVWRDPEDRGTD